MTIVCLSPSPILILRNLLQNPRLEPTSRIFQPEPRGMKKKHGSLKTKPPNSGFRVSHGVRISCTVINPAKPLTSN